MGFAHRTELWHFRFQFGDVFSRLFLLFVRPREITRIAVVITESESPTGICGATDAAAGGRWFSLLDAECTVARTLRLPRWLVGRLSRIH